MKAYTTLGDGIDALKIRELPVPEPGADEILVRMSAASLNFRDLLVVKGVGGWKPQTPRVPVSDGVGKIIAVGSRVSRLKQGDSVAGIFLPKSMKRARPLSTSKAEPISERSGLRFKRSYTTHTSQ